MKLFWATCPAPPAATPAGRAVVKLPPAKTLLPTTACDHTTPLTCHVGSASAETVAGVPAGGAVSAVAGCGNDTHPSDAATATTMVIARARAATPSLICPPRNKKGG